MEGESSITFFSAALLSLFRKDLSIIETWKITPSMTRRIIFAEVERMDSSIIQTIMVKTIKMKISSKNFFMLL